MPAVQPVAALLAAQCLSRLGRPDQAEPYYQQAGPLDLEDRHIRAYALVVSGRPEPAIRAYREILASRPVDVLALSRLGGVLISQGRWSDALEPASRLIKTPEGAVVGHTLAGVVYYNMRDPELALYEFDRVLELDPDLERMPLKPRRCSGSNTATACSRSAAGPRPGAICSASSTRAMTPGSPISSASPTISKGRSTMPSVTGGWRSSGIPPRRHLVADRQTRTPAGPDPRSDRAAPVAR